MKIKLQTENVTVEENWEKTHLYCPYCGKFGLWKSNKHIPNNNFNGIKSEYLYCCEHCQTDFFDIKSKKSNLEWDLQRIKQLKNSYKNDAFSKPPIECCLDIP